MNEPRRPSTIQHTAVSPHSTQTIPTRRFPDGKMSCWRHGNHKMVLESAQKVQQVNVVNIEFLERQKSCQRLTLVERAAWMGSKRWCMDRRERAYDMAERL